MPFKIRLKKSRQYNVVSKNLFVISVELLDRSVIECTLSSDSTGQDCLDNVCQRVGLQQPEFFGLRFVYKRHGLRWIELSRPLKKQLEKNACEFRLYLAVMFYIPDVAQLKDEVARYHYFLQLKKDIIEGHLPCTAAQAVMLTAYCLQAEFGNHDPEKHTCEYLKDFVLFPKQMSADPHKLEEMMTDVLIAHKSLTGIIPTLAEINYIQFAQQLDGYGYEFFPSKNDQGRELFLGISLMGVLAKYRDSQKSPFYLWTEIANLTHHKKCLVIESENGKLPLAEFQLEDADMTKYFWKLCVQQNKFYVKTRHLFSSSFDWGQIEENSWRSRSMPNLRNTVNHNPLFEMVNSRQHINNLEEPTFTDMQNVISNHPQISYENLASSYSLSSTYSAGVNPLNAYSTESLDHSSSAFHLDAQLPTSTSNISLHAIQPSYLQNIEERKAMLPAYRAAPDYATAVKQKYGGLPSTQVALSDRMRLPASHSYDSSLDRVQPTHISKLLNPHLLIQQPEVKSYAHYENYEDLAHLDEFDHSIPLSYRVMRPSDGTADGFTGGMIYQPLNSSAQCVMTHGLKTNALYPDVPVHTYSTPELTTQGLERDFSEGQSITNIPFIQQHKLIPPLSYIQRSSSSTPDLASQSVASKQQSAVACSNPNLMIGKILNNIDVATGREFTLNAYPVLNHIPIRSNFMSAQVDCHPEEAAEADIYNSSALPVLENTSDFEHVNFGSNKLSLVKSNSVGAQIPESIHSSISLLRISDVNQVEKSMEIKESSEVLRNQHSIERSSSISQVKDSRCQLYETNMSEGLVFIEFEQIPKKRQDADYTTALLPENSVRNRFKDVLPYEDNRVKIAPSKDNKTGYINASHVSVTVGQTCRFYIASQGPLPNTVANFWQMVWEQNAQIIVMLTEVKEHGRDKCYPYWPQEDNEKLEFGEYQVTKKFSYKSESYVTTGLSIFNLAQKKQRNLWHIQYTDWPDHGCPLDVHGFLSFMEEIDSVRRHAANEIPLGKTRNLPMVVHCSAGVGRSGVTILCDVMIYSLDHNVNMDISGVLSNLRDQRMLTVQTLAQYKFVYSVLIQYLKNSRLI
ncbi:hypothetical protein CHUAL_012259 [Chamberlinius hualienensis]